MRRAAAYGSILAAILSMPLAAAPAAAQTAPAAPEASLTLDLNALQPSKGGCRLTFVVTNDLSTPIDRAAFEMALFDKQGVVDRLTVLDFKDMPAGKTKVSRFDLSGADCADISRVLVNHATECVGAGIEPKTCLGGLKTETKSHIAFGL